VLGAVASLAAAGTVAVEHGFAQPLLTPLGLGLGRLALVWLAAAAWGDVLWRMPPPRRWARAQGVAAEAVVGPALLLELVGVPLVGEAVAIVAALAFAVRLNGLLARTLANPSALFAGSFLALIALTAGLLLLPAATPAERPIGPVDAVFTATSAVCVTGLTVRDTASGFTPFGQAVVLGAIQLGGLGVMIFGSTLGLLFGARPSYRETVTLSAALDEYPAHRIARFAWFIVLATLAIEAVGAVVILASWPADGQPLVGRVWMAVFHSVSAFCNAGFDITGSSMVGVRGGVAPYLGLMPLIVLGGLGFLVLEELLGRSGGRRVGRRRLSTHSRLVLATTAALLVGGTALVLISQVVERGWAGGGVLLDAAFMATSARTAGFTTVPMDELSAGSRFTLMVLMAVGGSPGSTAGGMKTVTFAILLLAVVSTVRGRAEVEVFGRALPDSLVKRAATVAAGLVGVVTLATLVLDMTERIAFEPLLFEVVSAATTTGLSLGATAELSPAGRLVIAGTMFLGRVGALTLLAALLGATAGGAYRLPRDTVSLG